MDTVALEKVFEQLLDDFYRRRIDKITQLKLKDALRRKNPYLYRATGVERASEIVEEILKAYMSSSDEGIFGDAFFEPLAKHVACAHTSPSQGIDIVKENEKMYQAVAVKSGPNVFNAQSRKKQEDDFRALEARIKKLQKYFDPIVGYCYGKKRRRSEKFYRELAGQAFWEELTGDADFYLTIIALMKDKPQQHLPTFRKAYDAALNRFTAEFVTDFCFPDGTINWEKLVKFNSGKE
jgi:hypothetical protein